MATPHRFQSASGGFTLVEILVVMVIVGIILTFAVLSVGDRAALDTLDTESRRLEQLFKLAQEDAELKGYEIGFRLLDTRYEFLAVNPEGHWTAFSEGMFRARKLTAPLIYRLWVEGRAVPPAQDPVGRAENPIQPQILLLSSGEATAFALQISAPGTEQRYRVEADALGRIRRLSGDEAAR